MASSNPQNGGWNRRNFLITSTASTMALSIRDNAFAQGNDSAKARKRADRLHVDISLNGQSHHLDIDTRATLLDILREQVGLTGTKKGCDHGQCGACTVLVDGRRILSCLTLTASINGQTVTTIEGLGSNNGRLHPMQQAFIDHDAFQCGYCTPGQIMSAIGCVKEGHAGTDDAIREYMSGNLCRCAAYPNIVDAINQAKLQMKDT